MRMRAARRGAWEVPVVGTVMCCDVLYGDVGCRTAGGAREVWM